MVTHLRLKPNIIKN